MKFPTKGSTIKLEFLRGPKNLGLYSVKDIVANMLVLTPLEHSGDALYVPDPSSNPVVYEDTETAHVFTIYEEAGPCWKYILQKQ